MTRLAGAGHTQEAFALPDVVESVVRCHSNGPLIAAAAQLWTKPDDVVIDVTYGRGLFWTHYRPTHLIAHDIALDGVDFRRLPEADCSADVVVFDPPYIPQGGRTTSTIKERSRITRDHVRQSDGFLERYGLIDGPRTRPELEQLVADGMAEATRVLRPGGRLWVKCMDYVSGGQYCSGRHHVVTVAGHLGLRQVDEFVHHSGLGPQPQRTIQEHSRRSHSFLCIFAKPKRHSPGARR